MPEDGPHSALHPEIVTVPTPDPTVLTRMNIDREINALKELIFTRLGSMDEAIRVAKADLVRVPTDVDKQVGNLKELHGEKFNSIETQFKERDVRVEQTARDTKVAVDAALQAAEKAVGKQNESFSLSIAKSEAATLKQIDAQAATITTATARLDGRIQDIKERLTRLESLGIGHSGIEDEQRAAIASLVAEVRGLRESRSAREGGQAQWLDMRTVLFALASIAIGIALRFIK